MKICVCADSHGNWLGLQEMVDIERPDMILFLGDGERDWREVKLRQEIAFAAVCGNCDLMSMEPPYRKFRLGNKQIFMTHGHLYGAKQGIFGLMRQAVQAEANLVLYGHTHHQNIEKTNDCTYLCPGSMGHLQEKYAMLHIADDGTIEITLNQLPQE